MRACRRTASLALLAGGLAACFSDRPPTAPEPPVVGGNSVAISNFAFAPPALSVPTGTTVTWANGDGVTHTVTADDGKSFDGTLDPGHTFQVTAGAPGTYTYYCRLHPFMKASLIVTAP
jgi:plastocyanin